MAKQQSFQGFKKRPDIFGGSLCATSHPKHSRPLESKLPIHLVLRATKGGMRLPQTYRQVNQLVSSIAKKHGVTLYEYANVGNHLHLLIKIPHVRRWPQFIRELTGRIALLVKQHGVGTPKENFWRFRPFTRIVRGWNKAFRTAKEYVHLNWLEAEGFISRKDTRTLRDLRAIWGGG